MRIQVPFIHLVGDGTDFTGKIIEPSRCLYLYADGACSQETKYLATGATGCQVGDWASYSFAIPSHGFAC